MSTARTRRNKIEENPVTENTDTVNETTEENSTTSEEATPVAPPNPGNMNADMYTAMVSELIKYANAHNQLVEEINSVGDRVALFDNLKANPERTNDPEFEAIVRRYYELSDALEQTAKEMNDKAEPFIQNALKNSGVEDKQEQASKHAQTVKSGVTFLQAMDADISNIPTLTGKKSTSSGSADGRGAGTPKIRNLRVFVDGKLAAEKVPVKKKINGVVTTTNEVKSNLTFGARAAGVTTEILREKFYELQGTKDPAQFKDRVEFELTDGKGTVHNITVEKTSD